MNFEFPKPTLITFTGIDNYTAVEWLKELVYRYLDTEGKQKIEFGVLLGGRINDFRYPDHRTISNFIRGSQKYGYRLAVHLCGIYARDLLNYGQTPHWLDLSSISRIQINASQYSLDQLERVKEVSMTHANFPRIILQHRSSFKNLDPYFHYLYDKSGGRGKEIDRFPERSLIPPCGYAGGITPENVREILKKIPGDEGFWIDMESGIRTNGLFDIKKCYQVCEQVWGPLTNR